MLSVQVAEGKVARKLVERKVTTDWQWPLDGQ